MAQIVTPKITTPLDDLQGSDLIDQAYVRLSRHAREIESDCRILCRNLKDWLDVGKDGTPHWQRLSKTWESFCLDFTSKPSEFVDAMLAGYEVLNKEDAIPLRVALEAAKSRSRPDLAGHGGEREGAGRKPNDYVCGDGNQVDNINLINNDYKGGTKTSYLADRLRRDHPDIFAGLERGEFPSVHAAAVAAGIRKKMVQHLLSVAGYARSIREHLSDDEIRELIEVLKNHD